VAARPTLDLLAVLRHRGDPFRLEDLAALGERLADVRPPLAPLRRARASACRSGCVDDPAFSDFAAADYDSPPSASLSLLAVSPLPQGVHVAAFLDRKTIRSPSQIAPSSPDTARIGFDPNVVRTPPSAPRSAFMTPLCV